jgi:hypothetical protein
MSDRQRRRLGWILIAATAALCAIGIVLYLNDHVGWAQMCWILASGTAGGGVMTLLEE